MSKEIAFKIDELQTKAEMIHSFEGSLHISLFHQDAFAISDFEWAFTLLETVTYELLEALKNLTDEAYEVAKKDGEKNGKKSD